MSLKSSFDFNIFYTFGSPVFVLESTLQQVHKISRWKPRSKLGVYVGKSHEHAGNITLVLDPLTSFVLPQFHLVHDDEFLSVISKCIDILPPNWNELLKYHEKDSQDELINTPLEATLEKDNNRLVKVKVKFNDETVIHLNDFSNAEPISIDIDEALNEPSTFLYEDSVSSDINNSENKENDNDIQYEVRTRYGRRIIKPK